MNRRELGAERSLEMRDEKSDIGKRGCIARVELVKLTGDEQGEAPNVEERRNG